jgi:hypothetical protein
MLAGEKAPLFGKHSRNLNLNVVTDQGPVFGDRAQ